VAALKAEISSEFNGLQAGVESAVEAEAGRLARMECGAMAAGLFKARFEGRLTRLLEDVVACCEEGIQEMREYYLFK
jgi:hypothetical protein